MATIIRVDGTTEELEDTSLKGMQAAVGGYIEYVPLPDGRVMYCDEEGKLKGKEVNDEATRLFLADISRPYDVIVGDVVVMEAEEA